jgi:hypothetical protein
MVIEKILIDYCNLFLIITICLFSNCNDLYSQNDLETTLKLAGSNRIELERVLSHYDKDKDSLKYKAAKYLISNMKNHYSRHNVFFTNDNHLKALDLLVSSAVKQFKLGVGVAKQKQEVWEQNRLVKKQLYSLVKGIKTQSVPHKNFDVNNLKSDWLIKHIDIAFSVLDKSSLIDENDFDVFLETLLPYRYLVEQLTIKEGYPFLLLKEIININEIKDTRVVVETLKSFFERIDRLTAGINHKNDLGFFNILKWGKLSCNQQTVLATQIMNGLGIPTYVDFTPSWLNRDNAHSWCVVQDSIGNFHPFSPWWQSIDDSNSNEVYRKNYFKRVSKVYRSSFRINEDSPVNFKHDDEKVVPFFDTFHLKDVTHEYHNTYSITISLEQYEKREHNLAYLSVFSPRGWKPIGWGRINKKKHSVKFDNVPVGSVYLASLFLKNRIKPVSSAFYINLKGEAIKIRANSKDRVSMKLFEKFPEKERLLDFRKQLIKGKFQGSNDSKFNTYENLYVFDNVPKNYIESISVLSSKEYRYVRFISDNKQGVNMAVMEYFGKAKNNEAIIKGSSPYILDIGVSEQLNNNITKLSGRFISNNSKANQEILKLGFDGNMETFSKENWVGIDFGSRQRIHSIRYAARNANNRINIGDTYELFYYDDVGVWTYLGAKKAKYNFLSFKNVPSGTMYWLKNLTKGKEELPFIYTNEKQKFVNHDNIEGYFN